MSNPNILTKMPEIGMPATLCYPSDCYPYTVVGVNPSGKRIEVQGDHYQRTDSNGQSESQTYTYSANKQAKVEVFTLRKNGRYHKQGLDTHSAYLSLGSRRAYQSPSI